MVIRNGICNTADLSRREKRRIDISAELLRGRGELIVERCKNALTYIILIGSIVVDKEDVELTVLLVGIYSIGNAVLVDLCLISRT